MVTVDVHAMTGSDRSDAVGVVDCAVVVAVVVSVDVASSVDAIATVVGVDSRTVVDCAVVVAVVVSVEVGSAVVSCTSSVVGCTVVDGEGDAVGCAVVGVTTHCPWSSRRRSAWHCRHTPGPRQVHVLEKLIPVLVFQTHE